MNNYTAAGVMPWKLLRSKDAIQDGRIVPVHLQLIPTNKCNGNCSWCSCREVDRSLELDYNEIRKILQYFNKLGTKAITITGGGEPTIHPHIKDILIDAKALDMNCGIVTNGIHWSQESSDLNIPNNTLTWLRISVTDTEDSYDFKSIVNLCTRLAEVDIGISFTVTKHVNVNIARDTCVLAEHFNNITHVRFVQDILTAKDPIVNEQMNEVERNCKHLTDKAIFQRRSSFTPGEPNCLISKLKPVINCDGYVYPCCGAQYATEKKYTMPESLRMCKWQEYKSAPAFDGSICKVCYYNDYNECLTHLLEPIVHERFV